MTQNEEAKDSNSGSGTPPGSLLFSLDVEQIFWQHFSATPERLVPQISSFARPIKNEICQKAFQRQQEKVEGTLYSSGHSLIH